MGLASTLAKIGGTLAAGTLLVTAAVLVWVAAGIWIVKRLGHDYRDPRVGLVIFATAAVALALYAY